MALFAGILGLPTGVCVLCPPPCWLLMPCLAGFPGFQMEILLCLRYSEWELWVSQRFDLGWNIIILDIYIRSHVSCMETGHNGGQSGGDELICANRLLSLSSHCGMKLLLLSLPEE